MKVSYIVSFLFCLIMPQLIFSMNEDYNQEMSHKFQNAFDEKIFDAKVKDILDKVKEEKSLLLGSIEYYVSHLPEKYEDLKKDACEELKHYFPDIKVKEIPILGFSNTSYLLEDSPSSLFVFGGKENQQVKTMMLNAVPCAILINTDNTQDGDESDYDTRLELSLFQKIGNIKFYDNAKKLRDEKRLFADLYALSVFTKRHRENINEVKSLLNKVALKVVLELKSDELNSCIEKIYNEYAEKNVEINISNLVDDLTDQVMFDRWKSDRLKDGLRSYHDHLAETKFPRSPVDERYLRYLKKFKHEEAGKFNERYPKLSALKEYIQSYF